MVLPVDFIFKLNECRFDNEKIQKLFFITHQYRGLFTAYIHFPPAGMQ